MAWKLLPTDYTNAIWTGLKKYILINNDDDTISLQDVTNYTNREQSFFGAKEANRMNEALNTIMSMVENGTDLYEAFQIYFAEQKSLFEASADSTKADFTTYTDGIKADYKAQIERFEDDQELVFKTWFDLIKGQLSTDAAGHIQLELANLDAKTDGFSGKVTTFGEDGSITEVSGDKKIVTTFADDGSIVQKLYVSDVLMMTKNTTFAEDGSITEEVS